MKDASRYALTVEGAIIDVFSIDPENRYLNGPYQCVSCGHTMVPALGSTRRHHFKHKAGRPNDCLHETYLHRVAKLALFNAISNAMNKSEYFPLTRNRPMFCDYHQDQWGITCKHKMQLFAANLAEKFDCVEMEKGVAGFIADIFLKLAGTHNCLLIEVSVTHPCEQEKIASGLPIVEIKVANEEDIADLRTGIDATSSSVYSYNLSPLEPITQRCAEPCDLPCVMLLLYGNGKVWYSQTSSRHISDLTVDHNLIAWEAVKKCNGTNAFDAEATLEQFKDFIVQQKYEYDRDVKACILCKHNGGQKTKYDIYCNVRERLMWMSSSAIGCSSYLPAGNAREAVGLINQNLQELPFD